MKQLFTIGYEGAAPSLTPVYTIAMRSNWGHPNLSGIGCARTVTIRASSATSIDT